MVLLSIPHPRHHHPDLDQVPTPASRLQASSSSMASATLTQAERAKGAIAGALVADAATMGLHWIYDQAKIQTLLAEKGKKSSPEFYEPPSCPFYQMPSGSLSPYGAELGAMLTFLAQPAQQKLLQAKQPIQGSSWAVALATYFKDVYKGYRNHSIKTLLANVEEGKQYPETGDSQDTQANSLCKLPAITAVYAGTDQLPAAVEAAVRAQQNNATSVSLAMAGARILEKVVLGSSINEALEWAQQEGNLAPPAAQLVKDALAQKGEPFSSTAQKLGVSCAMPGALQNALVVAATASSYEEGLRTNMVAGGDNCSRSVYLGALLGAAFGNAGVPAEWKQKVTGWADMEKAIDAVVQ